jgi:hypothetical protein
MTALARLALEAGPEAIRAAIDQAAPAIVEIERAAPGELPYRDFVRALLGKQGFKLDFNRLEPDAALAMVSDQLLGPGAFARERVSLAREIAAAAELMGQLGGARAMVAIRTYFAPGDLVWHVDRVDEATAYRMVWPIGRPAGMRVTPADNIDTDIHRAYMRREHALLGRLDTRVMRTGAPVEALWAHRPAQLDAMISGRFPFIRDPAREIEVAPGAASIHRIETPARPGTWHRSSWDNRASPGLQIVITAASDRD